MLRGIGKELQCLQLNAGVHQGQYVQVDEARNQNVFLFDRGNAGVTLCPASRC